MPPIPNHLLAEPSGNHRDHTGKGRPADSPRRIEDILADAQRRLQPDQVNIGCTRYTPGQEDDTGTWAELAQENAKVRYLLRHWVPYGMLTGVVGEPKVGKSAFAMGALVRPVVTGDDWYTCQLGSEPGY